MEQVTLRPDQLSGFYHKNFVDRQLSDYRLLAEDGALVPSSVVDVGGGCGFFALGLESSGPYEVTVLDADVNALSEARTHGVTGILGDALAPPDDLSADVICFNLILHHLVGENDDITEKLQRGALEAWRDKTRTIFINEYIYESLLEGFSARIIFEITRSRILSRMAKAISRLVPSLKANTFGVGVRFRTTADWLKIFDRAGLRVAGYVRGREEFVSLGRKTLGITSCRRDSFLLRWKNEHSSLKA